MDNEALLLPLKAWSAVNGAQISVVSSTSALSSALPNSLQVTIPSNPSGAVGVANAGYSGACGYWRYTISFTLIYFLFLGINVQQSWAYAASFFYKFPAGSTFNGLLTASLVASDGTTLASGSISVSGAQTTQWKEFTTTLQPSKTASDVNNKFVVTLNGGSSSGGQAAFFSMFSLFPPTFKGRANGMRMDIAQASRKSKMLVPAH